MIGLAGPSRLISSESPSSKNFTNKIHKGQTRYLKGETKKPIRIGKDSKSQANKSTEGDERTHGEAPKLRHDLQHAHGNGLALIDRKSNQKDREKTMKQLTPLDASFYYFESSN